MLVEQVYIAPPQIEEIPMRGSGVRTRACVTGVPQRGDTEGAYIPRESEGSGYMGRMTWVRMACVMSSSR